jgi:membrane protease YdiL (CAAX protease family)
VVLISFVSVYLAAVLVGLPLEASGLTLPRPVAELLLVVVHALTYVAVVRLLVVGTGALSWAEMGFLGPARRAISEIAWGAVLAGPVIFATAILSAVLIAIFRSSPANPLPSTGTSVGLMLNLISGAIIAPIGEEILFRGVATTAWIRSLGARAGIVRAALLFSALHVLLVSADSFGQAAGPATVGFLGRLPVALTLGWVYARRGSIWAPIGLHAAFNGVLITLGEVASASPPG